MHSKWVIKKLRRFALKLCAAILLLATVTTHSMAATQEAEEGELKAAFVYNFTLFTTWPKEHRTLNLCILGESVYLPLLKVYDGRVVNGAMVKVTPVDSEIKALGCQVLFIDSNSFNNIDDSLEKSPILTVTEGGGAKPYAAHITLMNNHDRVQFEINQTKAIASGLTLSYKLLKLAKKVH